MSAFETKPPDLKGLLTTDTGPNDKIMTTGRHAERQAGTTTAIRNPPNQPAPEPPQPPRPRNPSDARRPEDELGPEMMARIRAHTEQQRVEEMARMHGLLEEF